MAKGKARQAVDGAARLLLRSAYAVLRSIWFVRRPHIQGSHALALTSANKIILVKLRYANGWRLPGGGRRKGEDRCQAGLRELREEIGMTSHGEVQWLCDLDEITDYRHDLVSLVVVRDVEYRPARWSLEVEEIMEARLDALPADISPRTAAWLEIMIPRLDILCS